MLEHQRLHVLLGVVGDMTLAPEGRGTLEYGDEVPGKQDIVGGASVPARCSAGRERRDDRLTNLDPPRPFSRSVPRGWRATLGCP
jgi:hypothetical protein